MIESLELDPALFQCMLSFLHSYHVLACPLCRSHIQLPQNPSPKKYVFQRSQQNHEGKIKFLSNHHLMLESHLANGNFIFSINDSYQVLIFEL